ncbi:general transcription factor IIF subunit 1-like [Lytechinus variegatus]|uniref:general transcription factor IIF subunit 1-like n=1 Tax=Lytechinus variegatus TaxID=7654 RepID=UPI001BB1E33F|nr:general transcription factor IIF subunit 1-like [Lytechinus variegatus]
MAAPIVSCELSLKSGERSTFKYDVDTNGGKFSHQSLRVAIAAMQGDLNTFLTAQVEKEKQENALKNGGGKLQRQSKCGSAEGSGGGDGERNDPTGDSAAGSDSDDVDLDEDEDEEEDVSNEADSNDNQAGKREAKDWDSTLSKKSKLSDS